MTRPYRPDEHRQALIAEGLKAHLDVTREGLFDVVTETALTLQWVEQWSASLALEQEIPEHTDGMLAKVAEHRLTEVTRKIRAFEGRLAGTLNYVGLADLAAELKRDS